MASSPEGSTSQDEANSKASSLLTKSAQGATFLIILQIGSRALTFVVNQLLLRYLSPELLGIATQLEVYSISVLFFAREALRVAIQRQVDVAEPEIKDKQSKRHISNLAAEKSQALVNLSYISICLGILFSVALGWAYLQSSSSNTSLLETPYFTEALQLYGIAALCELLAEPSFVVVQQKSNYKTRAAAESIATLCRCFSTCGLVILPAFRDMNLGVIPFAIGQCVYGISLLGVYSFGVWSIASSDGFSLVPRSLSDSKNGQYVFSLFSKPLLRLGTSLFVQGVVKYVLTQGDVILISYLASLQAQGIYALASNYGGLIARMVFQPIEESSRNYFGKVLSSIDGAPPKSALESANRDLHKLLRFYLLLSVCAIAVGPTVAPICLRIIAGSKWTSSGAGEVLAKYCYYVPFLAVNGATEAFVSAVATESELNRQSLWMLVFSATFAGAGYLFLQVLGLGAEGLVWANIVNLAMRITWSLSFINNYFQRQGSRLDIMSMLPSPATIATGAATAAILQQVQKQFDNSFRDLLVTGLIAGIFVLLLAISERRLLLQIYQSVRTPKP